MKLYCNDYSIVFDLTCIDYLVVYESVFLSVCFVCTSVFLNLAVLVSLGNQFSFQFVSYLVKLSL